MVVPMHLDIQPTSHLIERWQAGNDREEIFRRLFDRYSRPVASFFKNRGFSSEECRELAQETFLSVYRGLASFRLDSSFETWLFSIARNLARNAVRDRSRLKRDGQLVGFDDHPPAEGDDSWHDEPAAASWGSEDGPLQGVLVGESLRLVNSAMSRLSTLQQQLVLLRFSRELKYREIASVLQIPEGTVKSQLWRACDQLRKDLGDHYPDLEA